MPAPQPGTLISIGTMNPDAMRRALQDPRNIGLDPANAADAALYAKLQRILQGGQNDFPENQHIHSAEELGLTREDLVRLGRNTDNLWLEITVQGSNGPVRMHANEFNAWQGSLDQPNATPPRFVTYRNPGSTEDVRLAGPDLPPDAWAARHRVGIQSEAERHGRDTYIESGFGERRIVSVGYPSELYGAEVAGVPALAYGYRRIIDRDPDSPTLGEPILVGEDGELDEFFTRNALAEVDREGEYTGPVVIKLRNEEGRSDPKIFNGIAEPRDAIMAEAISWGLGQDDVTHVRVTEIAGVRFPDGVMLPAGYVDDLRRTGASYMQLSGAQAMAYRYALAENQELRNMSPERWINTRYGSLEHFQRVFPGETLTLEQYHRTPTLQWAQEIPANVATPDYIRGMQSALSRLGLLDLHGRPPSGELDADTRAAITELQRTNPGIGSGGQLTNGVGALIVERTLEFNDQFSRTSDRLAYTHEIERFVRSHYRDPAVAAALAAAGIQGDMLTNGEFGAAFGNLHTFLNDPSKARDIARFRDQLEALNPATTEFNQPAPTGPTPAPDIRGASNEIRLQ